MELYIMRVYNSTIYHLKNLIHTKDMVPISTVRPAIN